MSLSLTPVEQALLGGASGDGAALAMRLVVRAAEVLGAERLTPITQAHVDSCLYHGQATLDFVDRLSDGRTTVAVPTTLNVGALDLLHPELWRGDPETAERGRRLMERYRELGCLPTYTCAPYHLREARPHLGEQVAWAESNAIVFCNSVLGARTNRYGDFIDVACAVAGRAPLAGLHLDQPRRARLVLRLAEDVPAALLDDDAFYPVLGIVLGRRAGSTVAVIDGLPPGIDEERLKALGAAAASSGAVALFHVVGSTPEAPSLAAALGGDEPEEIAAITFEELRRARTELTTHTNGASLRAVALGTPHASLVELTRILDFLGGSPVAAGLRLMVSTSRHVLADAEEVGIATRLRAGGVEFLVDTCSYVAPVLDDGAGPVMTDSGKWAFYAPATIGAQVVFGSTAECVASAVAGRVVRHASAWGTA